MRILKLQIQISIDGYIADMNEQTDWMVWSWGEDWSWDDKLKKYFNELTASVDCVLLSRKMAEEGFIDHWASMAEKPGNPQADFARGITNAHKVVFSKTLSASRWNNAEIAGGDLASEVNNLKAQDGKDIIVYGGATFVSALIKAGLVDEFYLFINPSMLGSGRTIFKEIQQKQNVRLKEAIGFECGVAVLRYELAE